MLKCQNVACNKFKATFSGIEWFSKAIIALRHIYKRLKPHTGKKRKRVRSDDIIMVIILFLLLLFIIIIIIAFILRLISYQPYTSKTYQKRYSTHLHGGNGRLLD